MARRTIYRSRAPDEEVDGRKPYYIRVNDKLEEVQLESIQEVLAGVPEAPDTGLASDPNAPNRQSRGTLRLPCRAGSSKCWSAMGDRVKQASRS